MSKSESVTNPMKWFLVLLLVALAAACGGNGSSTSGSATTAKNSSKGVITGFGSVFVNGVEFNTARTSVTINGVSGKESELKVGMVVKVDGTINGDGRSGNATSINFSAEAEGPISDINLATNTLTVLGQTVSIDGNTIFEGATGLSDSTLVIGDYIEVSGFRNASGIVASRIEKKTVGSSHHSIQIKGIISNLDAAAHTFTLGTLTVDYGSLNPFPALSNGLWVEVKANATPDPTTNILKATKIEIEDTASTEGNQAEVEGYISGFTDAASDFNVAGQAVHVAPDTVYESGAESDLKDGIKIEAEGVVTNGVLLASKVTVKQTRATKPHIIVEASVETIDANSITVLGQNFIFSKRTQMEDKTGVQPKLNITNISSTITVGDHVSVRGFKNSAGELIATRIERNANTKVVVQGPVEAISSPTLTILGLNVTTGSNTKFKTGEGRISDAARFFAQVKTGMIVKVNGTKSDTGIGATEIEIENESD